MRIVAPLRLEAWAAGGTRIGLRARAGLPPGPLLLAGVAGAVVSDLPPATLVVADRILLTVPGAVAAAVPGLPDHATPGLPAPAPGLPAPAGAAPTALSAGAASTPRSGGAEPAPSGGVGAGSFAGARAAGGGAAGVVEVGLPGAGDLAAALRAAGFVVRIGAIGGADAVVTGAARAAWAERGAIAVDMESGALARTGRLVAAVRTIVDTPRHPLVSLGTLPRGAAALRALRRAAPVLSAWAAGRGEPGVRGPQAAHAEVPGALTGEVENT